MSSSKTLFLYTLCALIFQVCILGAYLPADYFDQLTTTESSIPLDIEVEEEEKLNWLSIGSQVAYENTNFITREISIFVPIAIEIHHPELLATPPEYLF
ncbi:hypothetical protein [Algoriphagus sp.]